MFSAAWKMLKDTVFAFINDEALSRGAAIAFYTVTSIAPVLLIVIAIAGLAFGQDAAQNALTAQLSGLMGQQTAEVLQTAVASASSKSSSVLATMVGIITLIVTASGVFGEMQTALNAIWKAEPKGTTVSQLIRARAVSLGLVAAHMVGLRSPDSEYPRPSRYTARKQGSVWRVLRKDHFGHRCSVRDTRCRFVQAPKQHRETARRRSRL